MCNSATLLLLRVIISSTKTIYPSFIQLIRRKLLTAPQTITCYGTQVVRLKWLKHKRNQSKEASTQKGHLEWRAGWHEVVVKKGVEHAEEKER